MSAAQDQIENLYQTVLGRASDPGGLANWTNLLNSGTSIEDIKQGFLNSDEYKQKSQQAGGLTALNPAPTPSVDPAAQIKAAYKQAVGLDMPDVNLQNRLNQFNSGEKTLDQITNDLSTGVRHQVSQAYQNAYGRLPTAAEFESFMAPIQTGASTIDQLKGQFNTGAANAAQIQAAYKQAVGLDMPDVNLQNRLNQLNSGQATLEQIQSQLASGVRHQVSQAYQQATGHLPTPEEFETLMAPIQSGASTVDQITNQIAYQYSPAAQIQAAYKQAVGLDMPDVNLQRRLGMLQRGEMTLDQIKQDLSTGVRHQVSQAYQDAYGRLPTAEEFEQWMAPIQSGEYTLEDIKNAISDIGTTRTNINDLYKKFLGRDAEMEGLDYWFDKVNKGEISWDDLVSGITGSEEAYKYALAHPVSYFGDIYARDEWGNLIGNTGTDEWGNPYDAGGYQRGNYGFDTGFRQGENWDQYQNRVNGYYADAVSKMYEGILGRAPTAEELRNIEQSAPYNWYGGSRWQNVDLAQVQKNLALSPEAQANAAKNGTWLTLTKDVTVPKTSLWGYNYEVTEPVTKSVYIPPSVAGLTEAMQDIYNSDNPQALVDQIRSDPNAYMKQKLESLAWTAGWNQRVSTDHRAEASKAWDLRGSNEFNPNAVMQDLATKANDTAKWLLDNKVMSQDELANLWKSKGEEAANYVQRAVLDQIHEDGGGFWSGEWLGDFLEKYEVPIMTAILGGAVLGPLAGAAAEFGGAAAGAAATGAGAALPAVSTLPGYAALAGTAGATSTAVALASGAPTNKALLAGGLAAAGVGLGGALGPSGLNVAGSLTAAGMPPVLSAVTVGALSGGALGALSGAAAGDVGAGALGGALAGGVSSGVSSVNKVFGSTVGTLTRLAAGTAVGMLTGKDISAAFQGAAVGAVVGLAGTATKAAIDAAKSGKTDIEVSGKITPNAETVGAMRKAAEEELNGMLGNSDPNAVKKYVESIPDSYFTKALTAVDTETANAIKLAASYPTEAVKELYKEELGREPDAEGLKNYADALRSGMSLADIQSELRNSPEGVQYAARDTGTMTDASGDSAIPKDLTDYSDVVVEGDKSFSKVGGNAYTSDDNKLYTTNSSGKMVEFTPDLAKSYNDSISKFQGYLDSGKYNGQPLTQTQIDAATKSINNWKQDLAAYTANEIQTATPQELQSPSLWQKIIDDGASLFTFGTPGGGGVAVTGSGASGNLAGSKFSLFAFDGDAEKNRTIVYLEQATKNPELTPEQKAVAEKVLEDAKKTEPKTSGGEKPGSTTTETTKPGGDTGGGGTSTSVAPSGKPGESSASTEAIDTALNSITTTTLTAKQVQELTDPSSATAKAAASLSPGALSVANISSDVSAIYQTLLGRDADAEGLNYWVKQIQEGKMTLADVASAIANSEEAKNKQGTGTGTTGTATTGTAATGTTGTGTTSTGTGTGTAGTGTGTGTTGTGTGTGGGTGGGAGTGTGTGTGAGTGTGTGTGAGSSTGSGTGGSGTGTGGGTGGGTGSGGSGGGTGGGSGTGTGSGLQYYIPSLTQATSGLNTKFPNLTADVVGGPATIDLGGEFGAPVISSMSYIPIGGLTFASGGSVDPLDMSEEISADTSDQSSGADVITGGTTSIDLGGEFNKTPTTYNVTTGAKNYAGGGIIGEDAGGMVFEGGWPAMQLARMRANRFKQLANVPQVSGTAFAQGGHVPEFYSEGGLNNRYVNGNGDGTSDDVPAMLANGEFVIPADVVSALGNGSNDSGASVLDEFLQVIRAHKQNHDPKQLPPDSLGPLAYLNKATKKAGK